MPLPPGHSWQKFDISDQPGRWYYVGLICVGHVGPHAREGWVALVDRHLDTPGWRTATAPDRETAMRWVEAWACREDRRLAAEVAQLRIGRDRWPVRVGNPPDDDH